MPFISPTELKAWTHEIHYVVIGGGTCGLTLAGRLSEDPNVNVLVIEAGTHHVNDPLVDVPGNRGRALANPKYDWAFSTVPQSHANNRRLFEPRGKGLGGSSMLNYFGMFRPSKDDIDALEKLGNKGWNWDSLLHYMKKSETLVEFPISESDAVTFAAKIEREYHGTNGPLKKCLPREWSQLQKTFFDTAETLGIPRNPDTNGGHNVGAMTSLTSIDPTTGTRSYSSTAYLDPNLHRKNLLVLLDAQVTKIIFSKEGDLHKAVGVEFVKDNSLDRITGIQKDCIISTGSFKTPQLLELSGIGNPSILSKFDVETLIDLPGVGENLQDHIVLSTIAEVETSEKTNDDLLDPEFLKLHKELYETKKAGLLASGPKSAFMFVPAEKLGSDRDLISWQDQMHAGCTDTLAQVHPALRLGLEKQYAIQRDLFASKDQAQAEILDFIGHRPDPNSTPVLGKHYTSLGCALMHPLSRGTVHIASSDPLAPPEIDPNYFANEADLDLLVHIAEFALRMMKTSPLSDCVKEVILPKKEFLERGREGLKDYIRATCTPVFHPVGTASMLPREDGGVVDAKLKVYGTSNLRVVDLSILPLEVSCHTQTVAYGIGEKVASSTCLK
ncbi:alcohol oxidase [Schizopora paradoxa]|uniref:Alcohol oxidase n=1 Tax=Schizopora paradoxa TaxID=27342 RepID=A0A0H2S5E8_9AGAM|nr:alcohol oxidase [Schizopora paradoxa]